MVHAERVESLFRHHKKERRVRHVFSKCGNKDSRPIKPDPIKQILHGSGLLSRTRAEPRDVLFSNATNLLPQFVCEYGITVLFGEEQFNSQFEQRLLLLKRIE